MEEDLIIFHKGSPLILVHVGKSLIMIDQLLNWYAKVYGCERKDLKGQWIQRIVYQDP